MSAKKISTAARQTEIVMRDMAKNPGSTAAQIADRIGAASKRSIQNRLIAMRQFGFVAEVGSVMVGGNKNVTYSLAGELKDMLKKNREHEKAQLDGYHAKIRQCNTKTHQLESRARLEEKKFEQELVPSVNISKLDSGGFVEKTPTGRIFHLEKSRRKIAIDCIGSRSAHGCGCSVLAGIECVI